MSITTETVPLNTFRVTLHLETINCEIGSVEPVKLDALDGEQE